MLARFPPSGKFREVKKAFKLNVAWNRANISYNLEWQEKKNTTFSSFEDCNGVEERTPMKTSWDFGILASFAASQYSEFMHLFWIDLKQSFRNLSLLEVFVGSIGPPFRHFGNRGGARFKYLDFAGADPDEVLFLEFKLRSLENECFLWFSRSIFTNTEKAN